MMATKREFKGKNILEKMKMGIHDIRSPIAALNILQRYATNLTEKDKSLLENATQRIVGVVNAMENALHSSNDGDFAPSFTRANEQVNLSAIIDKILLEKKYEYKHLNIQFLYMPSVATRKCVINGTSNDLERMLSNLLNNAVEACDEDGIIGVDIAAKNEILYLTIFDNGKGMPPEVLLKLRSGESVTHGKENGHGIGFRQIRNTIKNLNGILNIESKVGGGSKFSIQFSLCIPN